jgi:hypothetical protein
VELAVGVIALALLAIGVGALGRHDAETPLGKEIEAEKSPVVAKVEQTGNGCLIFLGLLLIAIVAVIWITTGSF